MADWQVGDLALCVRGGVIEPECHFPGCAYPNAGAVYEVAGSEQDPEEGGYWLIVDGAPDNVDSDGYNWGPMWFEYRFIKVTPPAADDFDRETIELMNRVEQPA